VEDPGMIYFLRNLWSTILFGPLEIKVLDMETRTYRNIEAFNVLRMEQFLIERMEPQENDFPNLVCLASQGYWDHYGARVQFIGVAYLACAISMVFPTLRMASFEESTQPFQYRGHKIYCIERDTHFSDKPPYYIVARDIEITVHFAGEHAEAVFDASDRIERGEI